MRTKRSSARGLRWLVVGLMAVVICLCLSLMIVPQLDAWSLQATIQEGIDSWRQELNDNVSSPKKEDQPDVAPDDSEETIPYEDLFVAMQDYNRDIYLAGQSQLVDAWSYQADVFALEQFGLDDEIFGVISIPDINVELPLYLGATREHLSAGFAQLSQTSMPIGGNNTNCVVACHRGWRGMPYMRDVELLTEGDKVFVQNLWETLEYRVKEARIILPEETENIYIEANKDLLTIVTCHPYGVGTHRYLLICERYVPEAAGEAIDSVTEPSADKEISAQGNGITITTSDGSAFESSQEAIFWQYYFPWYCLAAIGVIVFISLIFSIILACCKRKNSGK